MDDEGSLIKRCRQGDARAFRTLVEPYTQRIFNTLYALVGSREDAEDLLQEALLSAYRSISKFKEKSSFYTWLYRIAVNRGLNELKRRQRRMPVVSLDQMVEEEEVDPGLLFVEHASDPERDLERSEFLGMIHRVLDLLSPEHRAVIILKDLDGCSQEEVAQVLHCSVGTVKSRLSRARERLKALLRPLYDEWQGEMS